MSPRVQTLLPRLYRTALAASGQRGSHTLGRLNARLFRGGQVVRLPGGAPFYLPPDPHFFGYLVGHEPHVADAIARILRPGHTAVDVGANIGYFTVQMARLVGAQGRVVAYEIDERNVRELRRNGALAAGDGCRPEIVEAAVSDSAGTLAIAPGAHSTLHRVTRREADGRTVRAVTLDDELERLGIARVDLAKIDVEGHEPSVLTGMERVVGEGRIGAMIAEVMPGEDAAEIDARLLAWRTHVASVAVWLDGAWREMPVGAIPRRTDILVRFR